MSLKIEAGVAMRLSSCHSKHSRDLPAVRCICIQISQFWYTAETSVILLILNAHSALLGLDKYLRIVKEQGLMDGNGGVEGGIWSRGERGIR